MNILLMYGGKSCEHDVSVVTAKQVLSQIKGRVYEVYVTKDGVWKLAENMPYPQDFANEKKVEKLKNLVMYPGDKTLYQKVGKRLKKVCQPDVAVLCFHGVNGEDGSVQGLLQLCDVAYTSCGIGASSLSMDKSLCKTFLKGMGAPVVDGLTFCKEDVDKTTFEQVSQKLGYPVIVKPANLGSSIGISVAQNEDDFALALHTALGFDNKVLVERVVKDCFDVNISVFKSGGKIFASALEKPLKWQDFLTFDDKYSGAKSSMVQAKREFPFECKFGEQICFWAKEIYAQMDCKGVVRIDFLVNDDSFFVNEINTIPGSFAYYLWRDNFDFATLVQMQIDEGIKEQKQKEKLKFLYESKVLSGCGKK